MADKEFIASNFTTVYNTQILFPTIVNYSEGASRFNLLPECQERISGGLKSVTFDTEIVNDRFACGVKNLFAEEIAVKPVENFIRFKFCPIRFFEHVKIYVIGFHVFRYQVGEYRRIGHEANPICGYAQVRRTGVKGFLRPKYCNIAAQLPFGFRAFFRNISLEFNNRVSKEVIRFTLQDTILLPDLQRLLNASAIGLDEVWFNAEELLNKHRKAVRARGFFVQLLHLAQILRDSFLPQHSACIGDTCGFFGKLRSLFHCCDFLIFPVKRRANSKAAAIRVILTSDSPLISRNFSSG